LKTFDIEDVVINNKDFRVYTNNLDNFLEICIFYFMKII
jgi:hypothetical protein